MSRYGYMPKVASMHKCKNILEIGVWSGGTAGNMIKASIEANNYEENINYYGFDLFEDFIVDKSVGDIKVPPTLEEVSDRLELISSKVNITLIKGNSIETVPKFVKENPGLKMDLIFIDGGHSFDNIKKDWDNVQPLIDNNTQIIFDDYWVPAQQWGCNKLIYDLDKTQWDTHITQDPFTSKGTCTDGSLGTIHVVHTRKKQQ